MDWETAKKKIWGRFSVLSDEDEIHAIEQYSGKFVSIYPMEDFDAFCKKHYRDRYLDIVAFVLNRRPKYEFDTDDCYFAWYMEEEELVSYSCVLDFVDDVDKFVEALVREDAEILHNMGFRESVVDEMKQALKEEDDR